MKREKIIPILNDEYKVIFTWGKPEEVAKILKAWGHKEHAVLGGLTERRRGVTFHSEGCHPVIAMPRRPKTPAEMGTLSHEAVHAVGHIFQMVEEKFYDTEIFAHSVGAVVRGVLR